MCHPSAVRSPGQRFHPNIGSAGKSDILHYSDDSSQKLLKVSRLRFVERIFSPDRKDSENYMEGQRKSKYRSRVASTSLLLNTGLNAEGEIKGLSSDVIIYNAAWHTTAKIKEVDFILQ